MEQFSLDSQQFIPISSSMPWMSEVSALATARQWLRAEPEYPGQYTWRSSFNYTTEMFEMLNNYLDVSIGRKVEDLPCAAS